VIKKFKALNPPVELVETIRVFSQNGLDKLDRRENFLKRINHVATCEDGYFNQVATLK